MNKECNLLYGKGYAAGIYIQLNIQVLNKCWANAELPSCNHFSGVAIPVLYTLKLRVKYSRRKMINTSLFMQESLICGHKLQVSHTSAIPYTI